MNNATKTEAKTTLVLGGNRVQFLGSMNLLYIKDTGDGESVVLNMEESITLAKAILIKNEVPFCNRVKGAGVEKSDTIS